MSWVLLAVHGAGCSHSDSPRQQLPVPHARLPQSQGELQSQPSQRQTHTSTHKHTHTPCQILALNRGFLHGDTAASAVLGVLATPLTPGWRPEVDARPGAPQPPSEAGAGAEPPPQRQPQPEARLLQPEPQPGQPPARAKRLPLPQPQPVPQSQRQPRPPLPGERRPLPGRRVRAIPRPQRRAVLPGARCGLRCREGGRPPILPRTCQRCVPPGFSHVVAPAVCLVPPYSLGLHRRVGSGVMEGGCEQGIK